MINKFFNSIYLILKYTGTNSHWSLFTSSFEKYTNFNYLFFKIPLAYSKIIDLLNLLQVMQIQADQVPNLWECFQSFIVTRDVWFWSSVKMVWWNLIFFSSHPGCVWENFYSKLLLLSSTSPSLFSLLSPTCSFLSLFLAFQSQRGKDKRPLWNFQIDNGNYSCFPVHMQTFFLWCNVL